MSEGQFMQENNVKKKKKKLQNLKSKILLHLLQKILKIQKKYKIYKKIQIKYLFTIGTGCLCLCICSRHI